MKPQGWADAALAGLMVLLYVLWPIGTLLGISSYSMVFTAGAVVGVFLIAERACNKAERQERERSEIIPDESPRQGHDAAA